MKKKDIGPAFPTQRTGQYFGMTLRDYFAGQALAGLTCGDHWPTRVDGPEMALRAYRFADAMLAEREQ